MADFRDIWYGKNRVFRAPISGMGGGNPNIGFDYASRLYGGVGGGSRFYPSETPSGVYRPNVSQPLAGPGGSTGRFSNGLSGFGLGALGVYSAYASGNQQRADATVLPALIGAGSFAALDKTLTQGLKYGIQSGRTSFPFLGDGFSIADKAGVAANGSRYFAGSVLQNGAPARPFQLGRALSFGNILTGSLLAYDAGSAASGSPLTSRQGFTNLGAGAAGLGAFYGINAGLAATGVGALPALGIATVGSAVVGSGVGAALGLRPLNKFEARALNLQNSEQAFLNSGLGLGAGNAAKNFGTRDFTKQLNPLQAASTGISTFFDLTLGAQNPLVTGPAKFFGAPTQQDLRGLYAELSSRSRAGAGEFTGLGVDSVAAELLKFGAQSGPVGNFGDVIGRGGQGGFLERVLQDTDSLIQQRASGLSSAQRYTFIEAETISRDTGIISTATRLADSAKAKRENIVANYRKPVLPSQTTKVTLGNGKTFNQPKTIGDLIAGTVNDVSAEIGRFFSRGEREQLQTTERINRGAVQGAANRIASTLANATPGKLAAYQQLLGTPASNRAAAAAQLSSRQIYSNGQGGYRSRSYSRPNYEAQYQARQAAIQAERGFSAATRLVPQKFDEALSGLAPLELERRQFDFRSVDAAVADLTPGSVTPQEYLRQYDEAYTQQFGIQAQSAQRDYQQITQRQALVRAGQSQYLGTLQALYKKAPTAEARFNVESAASRVNTSSNREVAKLEATATSLNKALTETRDLMDPRRLNSFSYFVAQTAKVAQQESQYLTRGALQTSIQGIRDQKYQLEQDRRLGLVSDRNYIKQDAELDRLELGKQYRLFNLEREQKRTEIGNEIATLLAMPTKENLARATRLNESFNLYQNENESYFNTRYGALTPEAIAQKQTQLDRINFSTTTQPYFDAIFSGAQSGTNPASKLGQLFSKQVSGYGGSAISNTIFDFLSSRGQAPAAGLLKGFFSGDQRQFVSATASALSQNRFLRGGGAYSSVAATEKTLGYGAAGYAVSQYAANYLSPYNNKAVGGLGSTFGGLVGSAFGSGGAFVGSAIGGLVGALPFTQNPVGGAATGALLGAGAGFLTGGLPGALIGGIGGLLSGLFGGQDSKRRKEEEKQRKAAEAARRAQLQSQGINYARSDLRGGIDYAADLFSGYGNYGDRESALNQYLSLDSFNARASANVVDADTLGYAQAEFQRLSPQFNPIRKLAEDYRPVISRPGAFQGAMFDIGLRDQMYSVNAGPFSNGPINQLTNTFQSLQSSLGQFGFDATRSQAAYNVFSGQYQSQLREVDYNIGRAQRDYGSLNEQIRLSNLDRGIDRDILNRQVTNFDRDSRYQQEEALGTLQRRENRSAIVARLQEEQAFDKDILLRKQSLFEQTAAFQDNQNEYQQSDALKSIEDLVASRRILQEGFGDFSTRLTNASDEFYVMSEALKEVNRQLELLSRNLR